MQNEVILRKVVDEDLPVFYEHQRDPEAYRMAAFPSRPWEAFMAHWKKIRADKTVILRAISYGGQTTGTMMSFLQDGKRQVGYWIGREYWGNGIATQALQQFLVQVKMRPLYAHVARHNIASQRVLEKCGFHIIGEEPGMDLGAGDPVPDYVLELK